MEYKDFKIRFLKPHKEKGKGEVFPISIESPMGNDQGEFIIPFSPQDLTQKLMNSGLVTRSASPEKAQIKKEEMSSSMHDLGNHLFSAIFSNKNVKDLYLKSLSKIQEHRDMGLRFKLCINPEYPELVRIMNLPWEYMFDRVEKKDFLNLFEYLPIVRYLDLKRPEGPIKIEKLPLKILVMLSSPSDCPEINVEKEKKLLEEAFAEHNEVEVDFLADGSLLELDEKLADKDYHIFHYIGHGDFDKKSGKGVLIFEEEGKGVQVTGEKLKRVFRENSTVGIVVLNACDTARISAEKDPFAGIAPSLMIENIFAVVAMQYPISDRSAIVFSKKFYTSLAQGYPIDQAIAKSRKAIDFSSLEAFEWGIPVLFMRSEDGVIFELKEKAEIEEESIPKKEPSVTFKFCKKCGEKLIPGAKFCKICGGRIS